MIYKLVKSPSNIQGFAIHDLASSKGFNNNQEQKVYKEVHKVVGKMQKEIYDLSV
jgi:hypothetical protein